ncbi:MAG: tetratricopeptide repeat protein [Desmonostoc vinosum HA7617-LM4]|jgi:tetratricopeptide (TPR) repeat protein|nr:tetratricopeptide repeat protein [Desmonostoc vinosum HA7617-LM4]
MTKKVEIEFLNGSFAKGFDVTLRVIDECQFTGKLPEQPDIPRLLRHWQENFQNKVKNSLNRAIPRSATEFNTSDSAEALAIALDNWLNSESPEWKRIISGLHINLHKNDEIEVIIKAQDHQIRRLPWQEWNLFKNDYQKAEIALSPTEHQKKNRSFCAGEEIRILAILGNSNNIDTEFDVEELKKIEKRGAKVEFIKQPSKREFLQQLGNEQGWHILFFAGHSNSDDDAQTGWLQINETEGLNIKQLKNTLTYAIERGLQLAIFSSCDGLGLANQLANLSLPLSIVMREIIPDIVAKDFLQCFLDSFSLNRSLYMSVRKAKGYVADLCNDEYPGIGWLPIICQNPNAKTLLSWVEPGGSKQAQESLGVPTNTPAYIHQNVSINRPVHIPLYEWAFSGREAELSELANKLITLKGQQRCNIIGIWGTGGMGKSALACKFASSYSDSEDFPGGVIYQRVDNKKLIDIAKEFADHCGDEIKPEDERRGADHIMQKVFRNRRALLIFDNAETQNIEQLLPTVTDQYSVIVTARDRGIFPLKMQPECQITLEPLPDSDALSLLEKLLGKKLINDKKQAAEEIINLVGGLPLALRIIGTNLQVNSVRSLQQYAINLRNEKQRLDNLRYDNINELNVRATFNLSLEQLRRKNEQETINFFSYLSVCYQDGFSKYAAKAASKFDKLTKVEEQLGYLCRFSLLNHEKGQERYVFHPLIRVFAQEILEAQPTEANKAKERHAFFYQNFIKYNDLKQREIASIVSTELNEIMRVAQWMQLEEIADFEFSRRLMPFFEQYVFWHQAVDMIAGFIPLADKLSEWEEMVNLRIQKAKFLSRLGEHQQAYEVLIGLESMLDGIYPPKRRLHCEAMWLTTRAVALQGLSKFSEAIKDLKRAVEIEKQDAGSQRGLSKALNTLAGVLEKQECYGEAIEALMLCLKIEEDINKQRDNRKGLAIALTRLATVLGQRGRYDEAIKALMRCLEIEEDINKQKDNRKGIAITLNSLGTRFSQNQEYEKAIDYLTRCLKMKEELKDRVGIAMALNSLSEVMYKQNENLDKVMTYLQRSAEIKEQLNSSSTLNKFIDILVKVLKAFVNQDRRNDALAYCQNILAIIPQNQRLLTLRDELSRF